MGKILLFYGSMPSMLVLWSIRAHVRGEIGSSCWPTMIFFFCDGVKHWCRNLTFRWRIPCWWLVLEQLTSPSPFTVYICWMINDAGCSDRLRTPQLPSQPGSSTARGRGADSQRKTVTRVRWRREGKKRTCVQMAAWWRRPHLCGRPEVRPEGGRSCSAVEEMQQRRREQVREAARLLCRACKPEWHCW